MQVIIKNNSPFCLPRYATAGSSGLDLQAHLDGELILQSLERVLIPTGLFLQIPQGYEAQIRSRSGNALNKGLVCLNSPGTIDADYRGEIKVIMINLSTAPQTIQAGDKIAQLVFQKVEQITWQEQQELQASHRGEKGFGHSGN